MQHPSNFADRIRIFRKLIALVRDAEICNPTVSGGEQNIHPWDGQMDRKPQNMQPLQIYE